MKITQEVRQLALEGMEEKSEEFLRQGAEIYLPAVAE